MNERPESDPILPTPQEIPFRIISPQQTDSVGTLAWRQYLNKESLANAWSPPKDSPYAKYQKPKLIESVEVWKEYLQPRFSAGEGKSVSELDNLIESGILGKNTAVILDSGGAHSVAMAVKLVKNGYQPIIMFDIAADPQGLVAAEQSLAVMLYCAEEMRRLKLDFPLEPNAPPVFIMDAHRNGPLYGNYTDNTYSFSSENFPSAAEFKQLGITNIVYLTEANDAGHIKHIKTPNELIGPVAAIGAIDLKPIMANWQQDGLNIYSTGIQAWPLNTESEEVFPESLSKEDIIIEPKGISYPRTKKGYKPQATSPIKIPPDQLEQFISDSKKSKKKYKK